jgi:Uma2 family endonuclease
MVEQAQGRRVRGPDVFAVLGVPRRERKSWVVWEEGKGPDVIVELLSDSTAHIDKGEKKQVYQDQLRVPEYFWYDPWTGELAGFELHDGVYETIEPDERGSLSSGMLELKLVRWAGIYADIEAEWLRWAMPDGTLLPIGTEIAEAARRRAEEAETRARRLEEALRLMGGDPDRV